MIKLLFISSLLLIFAKCNNNHGFVTGGPCSYDTVRFKALVIQIDPVKGNSLDSVYSVKVKFISHGIRDKDTMLLSNMTRKELNKDFLQKHDIKIGKVLTGVGYYIESGTCTPEEYNFDEPGFRY